MNEFLLLVAYLVIVFTFMGARPSSVREGPWTLLVFVVTTLLPLLLLIGAARK